MNEKGVSIYVGRSGRIVEMSFARSALHHLHSRLLTILRKRIVRPHSRVTMTMSHPRVLALSETGRLGTRSSAIRRETIRGKSVGSTESIGSSTGHPAILHHRHHPHPFLSLRCTSRSPIWRWATLAWSA